jgi:hypothetical protein
VDEIGCYLFTSAFLPSVRARALRAFVFLGSLTGQTGCCEPPAHRSFAASYSSPKIKNKLFPKTKCFLQAELGPPGAFIF